MKPRSAAATVLLIAALVTGCSGAPGATASDPVSSPSATAATFNDADVMFASMMIPHHEQAIEMSDVVLAKQGVDPQVVELAQAIKQAQGPEIEQLRGWLAAWGAEPATDHSGHGMDGMMSEEDMAALGSASGPEASKLFLEQMIEHHEGAVTMAETHLDQGQNPDALKLAQAVVDTQTAEIQTMRELLDQAR